MTDDWGLNSSTTIGWQQLSTLSADGGDSVHFVLRVDDQHPLLVLDARPSYIIDDIEA